MVLPLKYYTISGWVLAYAKNNTANLDIEASEPCIVEFGIITPIKTGLYLDVPPGYIFEIFPRSGLAYTHGITVINSPGQIDPGYREELIIIATSLSRTTVLEPYSVEIGDRVAQGRLVRTPNAVGNWGRGMDIHPHNSKAELYENALAPDRKGGLGSSGK